MTGFRYPAVGRCIYCGRTDVPLSDEHIIPYALGGNRVLPKASCGECAAITSRIELATLRGEFYQARAALSLPTRRRARMPAAFPLLLTRDDAEREIDVPVRDHLAVLPLPLYGLPAVIQTLRFGPPPEVLLARHGAERVGANLRLDHHMFARLLAKIGYSLAVAELGMDSIGERSVLPLVRGDLSEAGRWIGSSEDVMEPGPGDVLYTARVETYSPADAPGAPSSLIIVTLRLFANRPSPVYIVVAGTRVPS